MMLTEYIVIILAFLIVAYFYRPRRYKLPAGPKGWPIIGNLFQIGSRAHYTFRNWAKVYGPVYSIRLGMQQAIVINDIQLAREALVKKNKEFAGRPRFHSVQLLNGNGHSLVFEDYGERLKLYRKVALAAIRKRLVDLPAIVATELEEFHKNVFQDDEDTAVIKNTLELTEKVATNIIVSLLFGYRYPWDHPELQQFITTNHRYRKLLSWIHAFNYIPGVRFLPSKYKTDIKQFCDDRDPLLRKKLEDSLEDYRSGSGASGAILEAFMQEMEASVNKEEAIKEAFTHENMIMVLYDLIFAGSEALCQPLSWLLAYILNYPDVQRKIQQEIDEHVGHAALPALHHKELLHYLDASIREVLRHSDLTATGIPHETTCDTTLQDYVIPKGTTVIVNVHSLHYDEKYWEDPDTYNPSRFLDTDGKLRSLDELSYLPFSGGTRTCVGQLLAKHLLFFFCSYIFQRYEFLASEKDRPKLLGNTGINATLNEFSLTVTKRK